MSHKKWPKTQKPHMIDTQHSLLGVHTNEQLDAVRQDNKHSFQPPLHHINPHASFSPRTTLSKGRGK